MHTCSSPVRHRVSAWLVAAALFLAPALTGCVPDDDLSKATLQFQQSSDALAASFSALLLNANTVEADHYIDTQAFAAADLNLPDIQSKAILTPEQIQLRTDAIKALAGYTCALATLAAGKPSAQIEADTAAAGKSLSTLATDAATRANGGTATTTDYASPISGAVTAIGVVLQLIERHRGLNEVRASIRENDPTLSALYALLASESTSLYLRQKQGISFTGVALLANYKEARGASPQDSLDRLQIAERLKQWQRQTALVAAADPAQSIHDFQAVHDSLVAIILDRGGAKKESVAHLIAEARSFASDVTPLQQTSTALAKTN